MFIISLTVSAKIESQESFQFISLQFNCCPPLGGFDLKTFQTLCSTVYDAGTMVNFSKK